MAGAGRGAAEGGQSPLVVTVSATYGAGGSVVAPRLAERLGLRWLDRVVTARALLGAPPGTARVEGSERLSEEEAARTPAHRLFVYLARAAGVNALAPPDSLVDPDDELRESLEGEVRELGVEGGVLLGRAGAVVLADHPGTVHLRLDGPPERRLRRAAELEGVDLEEARRRMAETDRARDLYVRRLYRTDPADTGLYHLVLDTTALDLDAAVDLLVAAVGAFRGSAPGW